MNPGDTNYEKDDHDPDPHTFGLEYLIWKNKAFKER